MSKQLTLILFYLFLFSNAQSQQVIGAKALDIPQKFILPNGDQLLSKNEKYLSGNVWEVFSDRIYNKTTIKPTGGGTAKVLRYLEKFYVLEIRKKYVHIIKDTNISKDGIFSSQAQDYGWISSNNLLLWSHCIVDDNYKNKRVFIFRTTETNNYFKDLEDQKQNEAVFFQILYVLKQEKNRSLLVKKIRLYGNHKEYDNAIIGWVDNNKFITFKTNLFVEPRYKNQETTEIDNSQINHPIFINKKSVKKALSGKKVDPSKILWSMNGSATLKPIFFRFPINSIKEDLVEALVYYPSASNRIGIYNVDQEFNTKFNNGYCSISENPSNLSFNKVLLLSKIEVVSLLDLYDFIYQAITEPTDKLLFINKFRELFNIDESFTDEMLQNSTLDSFLINRYECYSTNNYNKKTINELFIIKNIQNGNNNEYAELIKNNLKSINQLLNNSENDISFISNGMVYYWLPCHHIL